MRSLRDYWLRIVERITKKQILPYHLKVGNNYFLFLPKDIIRAAGEGSYTQIITTTDNYLISKNLSFIEKELSGWGFVRINRSSIINVTHITNVIKGKNSYVIMSDGSKINIPQRKSGTLTKKVENMIY